MKKKLVFGLGVVGMGVLGLMAIDGGEAWAETMTVTINPVNYYVNVSNTMTNGVINFGGSGIRKVSDTVTTTTNSPSGYRLYISMNTTETNGNRLNLNGNSGATSYFAPTTGTVMSPVALGDNTWGFSVANGATGVPTNGFDTAYDGDTPSETSKWAAVPVRGSEQLIQSRTSENTPSGTNLVVNYGVKNNLGIENGIYKGTVVYSALAEGVLGDGAMASIAPSFQMGLNAGQAVVISTGLMTSMDVGTVSVTIGGNNCTGVTTSTATGSLVVNCTAPAGTLGKKDVVVSVPKFGKTYTITQGYEYKQSTGFFQINNMQQMTPEVCNSVATPSNTATTIVTSASAYTNPSTQVPERTLTDTRDNKTYKVRKLADGNCWMAQNLRLGGSSTISLNSTNSNLPSGSTFILPIAETSANHTAWATGASDSTGANTPHVYNTENNSYGNYYNWYTAVAGTANHSTVSQNNSGTITPNDAPGSICPKGWYLPGNGNNVNNAGYKNLLITTYGLTIGSNSTNATKIQASPLSFVLGGYYYYNGTVHDQGQFGFYWSRTPGTEQTFAFGLGFNAGGNLLPQNDIGDKVSGISVRCVANPVASSPFFQ